jgi:hypothetical protein
MKKYIVYAVLIMLSACSVNKSTLGLGRKTPDEFTVLKRQPLSMPPNYNKTPPKPGTIPEKEVSTKEEAEKSLFGETIKESNLSNEDKYFLKELNSETYDPNIREKLNKEAINDPANNKYLINNLMFWNAEDNSPVIDNIEEAKRLKNNKQQGKNINYGEVPIIEKNK